MQETALLPGLLRFELLDLSIDPLDLSLLLRHLPLQILFLLLPRLHLIADQGAADQSDSGADAGAGAGVAGSAADDRAQAGAGESSDRGAFFSRR